MKNIFLTSDTHFWHKNILNYCHNRPAKDLEEHNEILIQNWNSVVANKDIVYHLGDFCFSGITKQKEILKRLNGIKMLSKGNHDREYSRKYIEMGFADCQKYYILDDICMCHFPLFTEDELKNNIMKRDVHDQTYINTFFTYYRELVKNNDIKYILHGHIHDEIYTNPNNIPHYNVGVDVNNFKPIELNELFIR